MEQLAYFYHDTHGNISVSMMQGTFMNYTSYLVQKILTKDEWEEIMEYPETNYARISNYLKCRFLTEEIRNTILSQLTLF